MLGRMKTVGTPDAHRVHQRWHYDAIVHAIFQCHRKYNVIIHCLYINTAALCDHYVFIRSLNNFLKSIAIRPDAKRNFLRV